jgi:hypothetical protein
MSDTITCPNCTTPVTVPNLDVKVFNDPDVSLVALPHATGIECGKCATYLKPAIVALPPGIFAWVAAERPVEANRIITTPNLSLVN